MKHALLTAERSTCFRLNVGAIVVNGRNIISHGYNGVRAGEPHCRGNDCEGRFSCTLTTHAEENAIVRAGNRTEGGDLYCTDSPCEQCAALIVAYRIRRVFFQREYRKATHLDALMNRPWRVGGELISLYQVTPAGYVVDWRTKELVDAEGL